MSKSFSLLKKKKTCVKASGSQKPKCGSTRYVSFQTTLKLKEGENLNKIRSHEDGNDLQNQISKFSPRKYLVSTNVICLFEVSDVKQNVSLFNVRRSTKHQFLSCQERLGYL